MQAATPSTSLLRQAGFAAAAALRSVASSAATPSSSPAAAATLTPAARKAALKPATGRNRFRAAWRKATETTADAVRRKHEQAAAAAVKVRKARLRWAAAAKRSGVVAKEGGV